MSRNYELMREMEQRQALLSNYSIEPALTAESGGRGFPRQLASDLMAGLVQQVFFQPKQKPPPLVVVPAIDHANGCSLISASVAPALSQSAPAAVSPADANIRF